MTKNQNSKQQNGHQMIDKSPKCLGHWAFEIDFVWNLDLGFRSMMVVTNCYNLARLSSTLMFS